MGGWVGCLVLRQPQRDPPPVGKQRSDPWQLSPIAHRGRCCNLEQWDEHSTFHHKPLLLPRRPKEARMPSNNKSRPHKRHGIGAFSTWHEGGGGGVKGRLSVAKVVGGSYCRLQMPLSLALAVRETVAGHRLGALEMRWGGLPMHPWANPIQPRRNF